MHACSAAAACIEECGSSMAKTVGIETYGVGTSDFTRLGGIICMHTVLCLLTSSAGASYPQAFVQGRAVTLTGVNAEDLHVT
jgi:hypothetical protein